MLASSWGSWIPVGVVGLTSWLVWLIRRTLSHRYRPTYNEHRETVSVVVPVYREDPDVLERCLRTWVSQRPFEVVLVVDDRDDRILEMLGILDFPRVRVLPWQHTGKRGALGAGIRMAQGEIIVLTDSDTSWRPGLLDAIQMPFADPHVGGVGTRQFVYARESNPWRRIAHWLLNTRYLDYVPALSRTGSVPCLAGRPHIAGTSSAPCFPSWSTRSSWAVNALPAMTGASPGWSWPPVTGPSTRTPPGRTRCSPTPWRRSPGSEFGGVETPTGATSRPSPK